MQKTINMERWHLITLGYLIGIGSLFLISYRTLLAYITQSKSITIYINRYGEQYLDLLSLVFIWTLCIIGLIYLYKSTKTDIKNSINTSSPPTNSTITQDQTNQEIPWIIDNPQLMVNYDNYDHLTNYTTVTYHTEDKNHTFHPPP